MPPSRLKPLYKMLHPTAARWDIPILILLLLVTGYLEHQTPYLRSVNLDDPSLAHPHLPDIVHAIALILFSHLIPLATLLLLHLRNLRNILPLLTLFTLALFETTIITVFLTNILKLLTGRPRPYFASVCVSYAPHAENLCTGDAAAVREARKSFPSGHSALSFAAAVFLAIFLALRLRLSDPRVGAKTPTLLVVLTPLLGAACVAVSRTLDYHHHYADVVAGSTLGAAVAAAVMWGRCPLLEKALEDVDSLYQPLEDAQV